MVQNPTPALSETRRKAFKEIPLNQVPSPAFVVHTGRLEENCKILQDVARRSGAKILLALKGFASHSTFPIIREYLDGTTSSGLHEALLAYETFGKEVHVYSPAYKETELIHLSRFAHTLVFNSVQQLAKGIEILSGYRRPAFGLRVNPEYSEVETDLYDACAPNSRLGTTRQALDEALATLSENPLKQIDGLHFHALCEQDADALEHTVEVFEAKFGHLLGSLKWVNFGGGHHITRQGYDIERLCLLIRRFRQRYQLVEVYLEPGEAVALQTGVLVVTVLDIVKAGGEQIAIIDASATCHMPDVLEMPYRPDIIDAAGPAQLPYTYKIGGLSCLAGDLIGDYSFAEPLYVGQRICFQDMAHYTMVKTTTFNGVPLPAICKYDPECGIEVVRSFGYEDYKSRLS
ncbi:MAG: carboxynorspermidine decarboxylase [Verrucomicrobiota bacterium]